MLMWATAIIWGLTSICKISYFWHLLIQWANLTKRIHGWCSLKIVSDRSANLQLGQTLWNIIYFNISTETTGPIFLSNLTRRVDGWSILFQNCIWHSHFLSKMATVTKDRNFLIKGITSTFLIGMSKN